MPAVDFGELKAGATELRSLDGTLPHLKNSRGANWTRRCYVSETAITSLQSQTFRERWSFESAFRSLHHARLGPVQRLKARVCGRLGESQQIRCLVHEARMTMRSASGFRRIEKRSAPDADRAIGHLSGGSQRPGESHSPGQLVVGIVRR